MKDLWDKQATVLIFIIYSFINNKLLEIKIELA